MKMTRAAVLLAVLAALPSAGSAQLSDGDRATAAAAALRAISDTAYAGFDADTRLWLRSEWWTQGDTAWIERTLPPDLVETVQRDFARATLTDEYQSLFLCPPGEEVRMPGNGCPIRDGGRIITFHDLLSPPEDAGLARIEVSVTTTACAGECTFLAMWGVDLRRSETGTWSAEKVELRLITQASLFPLRQASTSPTAAPPSHSSPA